MRDGDRRLSIHGSRDRLPGGDMAHDASRIRTRVHRRTRRRATSNLIGKTSLGRWTNGPRPASRAARHLSFRRRKAPSCPRVCGMRRRIADADSRHRIDRPDALTCHACRIHIFRIRLIRQSTARRRRIDQTARRLTRSRSPLSVRPATVIPDFRKNRPLTERPRHRINRSNLLDDFFSPDASNPAPSRHFATHLVYRKFSRIMTFALPSCPLFFCYRLLIIREYHHSM